MKGTVLDFSIQQNQGVISGDDGKRYKFTGADWNIKATPEAGIRVDFEVNDNLALAIYEDPNSNNGYNSNNGSSQNKEPKSKTTAGLIAILIGGLGIHFFYLESWGWGLLSILFCWTYIPMISGFILGVRYLMMSEKEFQRKTKYLRGQAFGKILL